MPWRDAVPLDGVMSSHGQRRGPLAGRPTVSPRCPTTTRMHRDRSAPTNPSRPVPCPATLIIHRHITRSHRPNPPPTLAQSHAIADSHWRNHIGDNPMDNVDNPCQNPVTICPLANLERHKAMVPPLWPLHACSYCSSNNPFRCKPSRSNA